MQNNSLSIFSKLKYLVFSMRRCVGVIVKVRGSLTFSKSHSNLADAAAFLQGLENCDILKAEKREKAPITQGSVSSTQSDKLHNQKVAGELQRQLSLQKTIKAAQEEIRVLRNELQSISNTEIVKERKALPSAKQYMSSGELLLEGSPQYLKCSESHYCCAPTKNENFGENVPLVSLVARVCSDPSPDLEDTASCIFSVDYNFSTCHPNVPQNSALATVKCFGETLRLFALSNVHVGDIVHILGTLLPPNKKGTNIIGIPSVGGNLSIVLSSD